MISWPKWLAREELIIMAEKQNRLKSWALWVSVAGLIVFLVKTFANIDIAEWMDQFLNVLCPVLVGFGIINNPTDKYNL